VAVGGSAVACFSSAKTTLEKKRFPGTENELEIMVRNAPLNAELDRRDVDAIVDEALSIYRGLDLGDRVPRAVWFNILHVLGGVDEKADLDFQIHSDVIDRVLMERARRDAGILERRDSDRLGRWHPTDVYAAFPTLVSLFRRVSELANCGFEFLGPGGDRTIAARTANSTDWWPVAERRGS
jgi:hypothetical protein